jgi:ribosomal protein S18 acetylase RimI-like enzyme
VAITIGLEPNLSVEEFREVLVASTLGARRPVSDPERLGRMLSHANLIVTARDGERLVGVSRALTDFSYCCYLSDLAVDVEFQHQGIGRKLIAETHKQAGEDKTTLILVSAPAAEGFYPKIGMKPVASGWIISRNQ